MWLLRTRVGKWTSWLSFSPSTTTTGESVPAPTGANSQLADYRSQIAQLRARNQQLEQTLAETTAAHRSAMLDQRRTETALRERLEQSRSAFEIAWSGFTAEPAIEDQLATLDPGNDRARRWLLKT